MKVFISPEIKKAVNQSIGMFQSNWFKFNTPTWEYNMQKLMYATFRNAHPPAVVKAAGHAMLEIDGEFPPSMGKIIKVMREYLGSGQTRSPKPDSCTQCNAGLRLVVFWEACTKTGIHKNMQVWQACSGCEYGQKRKKTLKIRTEHEFVDLVAEKNKNYVASRGIWLQQKTDQQPPLIFTKIDEDNFYTVHERKKETDRNTTLQKVLHDIKERLVREAQQQKQLAEVVEPPQPAEPPQPEEDVVASQWGETLENLPPLTKNNATPPEAVVEPPQPEAEPKTKKRYLFETVFGNREDL